MSGPWSRLHLLVAIALVVGISTWGVLTVVLDSQEGPTAASRHSVTGEATPNAPQSDPADVRRTKLTNAVGEAEDPDIETHRRVHILSKTGLGISRVEWSTADGTWNLAEATQGAAFVVPDPPRKLRIRTPGHVPASLPPGMTELTVEPDVLLRVDGVSPAINEQPLDLRLSYPGAGVAAIDPFQISLVGTNPAIEPHVDRGSWGELSVRGGVVRHRQVLAAQQTRIGDFPAGWRFTCTVKSLRDSGAVAFATHEFVHDGSLVEVRLRHGIEVLATIDLPAAFEQADVSVFARPRYAGEPEFPRLKRPWMLRESLPGVRDGEQLVLHGPTHLLSVPGQPERDWVCMVLTFQATGCDEVHLTLPGGASTVDAGLVTFRRRPVQFRIQQEGADCPDLAGATLLTSQSDSTVQYIVDSARESDGLIDVFLEEGSREGDQRRFLGRKASDAEWKAYPWLAPSAAILELASETPERDSLYLQQGPGDWLTVVPRTPTTVLMDSQPAGCTLTLGVLWRGLKHTLRRNLVPGAQQQLQLEVPDGTVLWWETRSSGASAAGSVVLPVATGFRIPVDDQGSPIPR